MATTQGKEKRSGSGTGTRSSRQSTSTSKPSTIDKEKEKPARPLPNYLKPTISSSESVKLVKKNKTNDPDQKFLRRKSFDVRQLPSTSSRTQKELVSPVRGESIASVLHERKTAVQSASYNSSRTSSSASKTTKATAAVKSQPHPSRGAKKSATSLSSNNKKEYDVSPLAEDASSSHDTPAQALENETTKEEAEEDSNEFVESEMGEQSDVRRPEIVEDVTVDEDDEKFIKSCDISAVSESEDVVQPTAISRIQEDGHKEDESDEVGNINVPAQATLNEDVKESEESTDNGAIIPEENIIEEVKPEVKDVNNTADEDQQAPNEEEAVGDHQEEESVEMIKAKEGGGEEEEGQDQQEVEQGKQENIEPANVVTASKRQGQGQGKKESPTAYNDVIEETASRLLEKKKNKVRALVGAFETVIDHESASTPKGS